MKTIMRSLWGEVHTSHSLVFYSQNNCSKTRELFLHHALPLACCHLQFQPQIERWLATKAQRSSRPTSIRAVRSCAFNFRGHVLPSSCTNVALIMLNEHDLLWYLIHASPRVPLCLLARNHTTCAMHHAGSEKKATPPLVQDAQDLGFKVKVREASEPLPLDHSSLIIRHHPLMLYDFLVQNTAWIS